MLQNLSQVSGVQSEMVAAVTLGMEPSAPRVDGLDASDLLAFFADRLKVYLRDKLVPATT
jgi:hypothetical protein